MKDLGAWKSQSKNQLKNPGKTTTTTTTTTVHTPKLHHRTRCCLDASESQELVRCDPPLSQCAPTYGRTPTSSRFSQNLRNRLQLGQHTAQKPFLRARETLNLTNREQQLQRFQEGVLWGGGRAPSPTRPPSPRPAFSRVPCSLQEERNSNEETGVLQGFKNK